jgi:hypothetical protein
MSVSATRTTTIVYSGDVTGTETIAAALNAASPGSVTIQNLASGLNTITVPVGSATVVAATIVPPVGNVTSITLKGVTGDTGILLHLTDPTTIALAAAQATFVLTTGGIINGVRIFWT